MSVELSLETAEICNSVTYTVVIAQETSVLAEVFKFLVTVTEHSNDFSENFVSSLPYKM
jgi:hypothetical protein